METDYKNICDNFLQMSGLKLIYESHLDPSRKTYLFDDIVIKSSKIDEDSSKYLRANNLEQEYKILKNCSGIRGIPQALYYSKSNNYEIILLTFMQGVQLEYLKLNLFQFISILWKLFKLLLKLSAREISHNDVVPLNVLVTEEFELSLVDFDQAVVTSKLKAFAGNIIGIKTGKSKVSFSMITIIKDFLRNKFPNLVYSMKQALNKNKSFKNHKLQEINENAEPEIKKMLEAWKIAQKSNASSPGMPVAYYSLDFKGIRFPGERPWIDRWNRFKDVTAYNGKTIIELGCNMGLLSTYLLKERDAERCVGVDHDTRIIVSAQLIGDVYNVNPEFFRINFDSKDNWEERLLSYNADIIFALNVLNWLNDKQRFLNFLANFPQVIFEGHDSTEIEKKRFQELGFTNIAEIGISDRERIILKCVK